MYNDTIYVSFPAGEAIGKNKMVKVHTDGTLLFADAANLSIGPVTRTAASGETVAVRTLGKFEGVAAGAIAIGSTVYNAADGKVDDNATAGGAVLGVCVKAAAADGDTVEWVPFMGANLNE